MSVQERALLQLASFLQHERILYMVIGGLANVIWGEPRATIDIDVTVWVEDNMVAPTVTKLTASFASRTPEPLEFVRQTRVLPLETQSGVAMDVVFGLLPFEREAIERAKEIRIAGAAVRFITAEDLILMKIISERPRDADDARGVALRRMKELDLSYLEPRIEEFAALLTRPEVLDRWRRWRQEASQFS